MDWDRGYKGDRTEGDGRKIQRGTLRQLPHSKKREAAQPCSGTPRRSKGGEAHRLGLGQAGTASLDKPPVECLSSHLDKPRAVGAHTPAILFTYHCFLEITKASDSDRGRLQI